MSSSIKQLLAIYFVKLLHFLFLIYIISYPFINAKSFCHRDIEVTLFHVLYLTTCVSLLVHWYLNDDTCFLTLLEAKLRGKKISDGFIYQIVSPVYKFPSNHLTKLSYTLVIVNFIIISAKLAGK